MSSTQMRDYLKVCGIIVVALAFSIFASASTCSSHSEVSAEEAPAPTVFTAPVGSAPDLTPAAEAAVHAVVHIKIEGSQVVDRGIDPLDFFFGGGGGGRQQVVPTVGYGSGVIMTNDGYIITNNHVIDGAKKILVTLNDNREFTAKLIGADPYTDLALLKIEADKLSVLPVGDSDKLRLGEWVLAVGNPFNLTSTVTAGIVSAKARSTPSQGSKLGMESFIQTDAAVNPGNSGGALVNARGELVGINTRIYSKNGQFAGYSFAIPVNAAVKVSNDLKKYGQVQRAVLGLTVSQVTPELTEKYKLKVSEGMVVVDFSEVSSALSAGIKEGDVIVNIAGKEVTSMGTMQDAMSRHSPGEKVKVTVDRKGDKKTVTVTLKNEQGGTEIVKVDTPEKTFSATFGEIAPERMYTYGIRYGIEVTDVKAGKLQKAGVKKGFIILSANNEVMKTVADLSMVMQRIEPSARGTRQILLKGFYPEEGSIRTVVVDLGK